MRNFIKEDQINGYANAKAHYQARNQQMTLQEAFDFFEVNLELMANIPQIYELVKNGSSNSPQDSTLDTFIDMHKAYNQALIRDFAALKQDIQQGGKK